MATVPETSNNGMTTAGIELMRRLGALQPTSLKLDDESHLHEGHPGAADGGRHFRLLIVSHLFEGLASPARHRMVYEAAGDLMGGAVHALSIRALTPGDPDSGDSGSEHDASVAWTTEEESH